MISRSILEKNKTNHNPLYSVITNLNSQGRNLSNLISESLKNIRRNSIALRTIIDIASDQEVSGGPLKIDLSKVRVESSDGLFIDSGRIKRSPIIKDLVSPEKINIKGSGDSYITVDESGEKIESPRTYYPSDIAKGLEFQYQDNGFIELSLDCYFKRGDIISVIALDTGDSFTGRQTKIESIILSDSRTVKFDTVRVANTVYIIAKNPINSTNLTIKMSSSGYVSSENVSLLKIRSLKFGQLDYKENPSIVIGPIGSNSFRIIKAGISTSYLAKGVSFKYSTDASNWAEFDTENERGFSLSLNTLMPSSKNIETNKIFIMIEVTDDFVEEEVNRIDFIKYEGEDCYDTTLSFGGGNISNVIINDYLQSIYDTVLEKYIYVDDIDPLKNYRVSLIPYNPVNPIRTFKERYNSEVVVNPTDSRFYLYGAVSLISQVDKSKSQYVYKKREDYIPGKYSYIINGENKKSFDIYGDYEFSLSRFTIRIKKEDTIYVRIENESGVKVIQKESLKVHQVSDTEELITIAPLFIEESITYKPAFFYPYKYSEEESITENGSSQQNPLYAIPYVLTDYPDNKTTEISIRDLDNFEGFIRVNQTKYDREKIIRTRHRKIRNVTVLDNKHIGRVYFIDGDEEFRETKRIGLSGQIINNELVATGVKAGDYIEIYTAGYAKKLIQVHSEIDIVSDYNFMVQSDKIIFHSNMNNETVNVSFEDRRSDKIIGNLFSVDYEEGVIYFSSYQNDITIRYEFLDMSMTGTAFVTKNIAQEGVLEPIGIEEGRTIIKRFNLDPLPSINIGVIYE